MPARRRRGSGTWWTSHTSHHGSSSGDTRPCNASLSSPLARGLGVGQHRGQHPDDRPQRLAGGPAGGVDRRPRRAQLLTQGSSAARPPGRTHRRRTGHQVGTPRRPAMRSSDCSSWRAQSTSPGVSRHAGRQGQRGRARRASWTPTTAAVERPAHREALVEVVRGHAVRHGLLGRHLAPVRAHSGRRYDASASGALVSPAAAGRPRWEHGRAVQPPAPTRDRTWRARASA